MSTEERLKRRQELHDRILESQERYLNTLTKENQEELLELINSFREPDSKVSDFYQITTSDLLELQKHYPEGIWRLGIPPLNPRRSPEEMKEIVRKLKNIEADKSSYQREFEVTWISSSKLEETNDT